MKRRNLLIGAGVTVGAGALVWTQRNSIARSVAMREHDKEVALALGLDADTCVVMPDQTDGPFFISAPERSDVREDRDGLPLTLDIQVVSANTCAPVDGALVEIWHCDAAGAYSGYPEDLARDPTGTMLLVAPTGGGHVEPLNEKRFLRGAQVSNAQGMVRFQTIFPGWYEPRVPHVHVKVIQAQTSFTSQLYFADSLVEDIYTTHPVYKPHGSSPYKLTNDGVIAASDDASGLMLQPTLAAERMVAGCRLTLA